MGGIKINRLMSGGMQTFALCLCIALTSVAMQLSGLIPYIVAVFTGFVALLLTFFRKIEIDMQNRLVVESCRFLNLMTVSQKQYDSRQFDGVKVYCTSEGIVDDIASTWRVAFRLSSGRLIDVRQFSSPPGQVCPEAEAFAHELSSCLGLKLISDELNRC